MATITGTLLDQSQDNRPIRFTDVEFVNNKDGNVYAATTDRRGVFSTLVQHEPGTGTWGQLDLPSGVYTLRPNESTYDSYYFFDPKEISVPEDGNLEGVEVEGDNLKNAKQLETYVINAIGAARDIFMAEMKRYPHDNLTEDEVRKTASVTMSILSTALDFITLPRFSTDSDEDTPSDDEVVKHMCSAVSGRALEHKSEPRYDNIPCSLCYTRYSTNPTRLQTCLCCAPCTGG